MGSANLKIFPNYQHRVEQLGLILILMPHNSADKLWNEKSSVLCKENNVRTPVHRPQKSFCNGLMSRKVN